jgi:hypothetical protein
VARLAEALSREGYMAESWAEGGGYVLVENHCPICVAATSCQGFCRAELDTFREEPAKCWVLTHRSSGPSTSSPGTGGASTGSRAKGPGRGVETPSGSARQTRMRCPPRLAEVQPPRSEYKG